MTTLAKDNPIVTAEGARSSIPIIASDIVFEGALVGDNGAGYGRPLTAGDKFQGHAVRKVDNSAGSAGDKNIELRSGHYRAVVALVALITDVGQPVYASDDGALTMVAASTSAYSYVGIVTRYVSATKMEVEFRPNEYDEFGNSLFREITAVDKTLDLADGGKIIYVTVDTKIITLDAIATALSGYKVTIVNGAGFGVAGIVVDANSSEVISGGCDLAAGGAGKKFTNTKTTAQRNDFIELAGNATGWNITNLRGTWAIES
jgi:hypothetical protein